MKTNHGFKTIIMLFNILLLVSVAYAADYYVSPTGNDSNPGTIDKHWQHIAFATCGGAYGCPIVTNNPNKLKAGDTLYIKGGIYNEHDIVFANSGSSGNYITIKNYPNETPIINGGYTTPSGSTFHPTFEIDNKNYIMFDGLEITQGLRANVRIAYDHPTDHIIIQNCNLHDFVCSDNSGQFYIGAGGASNITIKNNLLHGVYNYANRGLNTTSIMIFNAHDNIIIQNNEIYHSNKAIYYKHSDNSNYATTIKNNLIYDMEDSVGAISLNMQHVVVENNIIRDSIKAIRLWHDDALCSDLITSYITLNHNTIVDCTQGIILGRKWVSGTKCDGANNTTITNNIVYGYTGNEHRGLSIHANWQGDDNIANNGDETDESATTLTYNLFYSSTVTVPISMLSDATTSPYNGYFDTTSCPASMTCSNNTQSAPNFVDYTGKNFTLAAGSAGKNAASDGTDIGADISKVGPIQQTGYKKPKSPLILQ
ncbi:MAG: hypothetical protein WA126_09345 [Thermodesulfovibrionales bacterium]